MSFYHQRIIVTGASSGIGAQLCRQLAAQGARLSLAARRTDLLDQVAADCRRLGGTAMVVPTNVTEAAQCRSLVDRTVAAFGGLDMLICNAGISLHALFEDLPDLALLERMMAVNYLGAVYCTQAALPHLLASAGRLVAVSILAGKAGIPTLTGYSASKHALHGFFDALRVELVGSGVSVTVVCPSSVASGVRRYVVRAGVVQREPARPPRPGAMSVERCAELILRAASRRQREVLLTTLGKVGRFIRPFFPGLIDRIARRKVGLRP